MKNRKAVAKTLRALRGKRSDHTKRKKMTDAEWEAQLLIRPPDPDYDPDTPYDPLHSIDLRQAKFSAKPYEGGAPGLRSQGRPRR